jgi:hypothetical protein
MKKIILVLAIAFVGCSQPTDSPVPIGTNTTTTTVQNSHNFEGQWNCYDWVVDDITGMTAHRKIIFSNQSNGVVDFSLNQYTSGGILIQMITSSPALIDSNYFDNPINPIPEQFKGVLTSDSTLMVYDYDVDGVGAIDTIQVREFKR